MKKIWIAGFLLVALTQPDCRADTLQQVVIVTRHGVRAPTWTSDRLNQYSATSWPDFGVPPGYLTAHGRALMKIMGGFYRESYLSLGLLHQSGCEDVKRVYFGADTDQRTIESARALTMASKLSLMSAWRSPGMIQKVSLRIPSTTYSATSSGCTARRGLPLAFIRRSISS